MSERRALVVGAGYVGGVCCDILCKNGWQVWALRRSGHFAEPIRTVKADVSELSALRAAVGPEAAKGGFDAVVYAVSADERTDEAYRAAYVTGIDNILKAVDSIGRFILVSSTGVFHQVDGERVDECSPTEPAGFSGKRLLEGEAIVRAFAGESSIVRLGGIYGPRRTRLRDMVIDGRAFAALGAPRFQNRIHRDDAAGFVVHLLERQEPPELLYLGVDDEPADLREVQAWLCERFDIDPGALTPPTRSMPGQGKRCVNARLRDSGYELRFPTFRQGYADGLGDDKL